MKITTNRTKLNTTRSYILFINFFILPITPVITFIIRSPSQNSCIYLNYMLTLLLLLYQKPAAIHIRSHNQVINRLLGTGDIQSLGGFMVTLEPSLCNLKTLAVLCGIPHESFITLSTTAPIHRTI